MATKGFGPFGTFFSGIFTAVVAPVTVSLVIQHVNLGEAKSIRQETTQPATPLAVVLPERPVSPPEQSPVIAQGIGWTPEEALQDALRNALRTTVTGMVDANVWARHGQDLFTAILRDSAGLIVSHRDLRFSSDWQQGRQVYSRTVNVVVARQLLCDRLATATALIH